MSDLLLHSRTMGASESGVVIEVTPAAARWEFIRFGVRQLAAGGVWQDRTGDHEACLVLLSGMFHVRWDRDDREHGVGPRASVFSGYPHAVYLPAGTGFRVVADELTRIADCRAPSAKPLAARIVRPEDCGFEIRGGGNATRQIVDILPPAFPADRLLICEVYTPGGNWSSYPPHKHDEDNPPVEADLDETYYFRIRRPEGYAFQRLYRRDGSFDQTFMVRDGDLLLIRDGYHPFVTAHGFDAYYLNVLAGSRRSMAAADDPDYAHLRHEWPAPDPRLPMVEKK
jgi:5-deoxy-glucuronate isomerase